MQTRSYFEKTDELHWKSFSGEIANEIAVSILDSFGLDLPVLDSSLDESRLASK